jgi:hypothetical protein
VRRTATRVRDFPFFLFFLSFFFSPSKVFFPQKGSARS